MRWELPDLTRTKRHDSILVVTGATIPRVVITTTSDSTLDYINLASIHGFPWSMSSWMIHLQRHWALNIHLCVIVINGPGNGLVSVRPKPLTAPTRTYCRLDSYKQTLNWYTKKSLIKNCVWNCRLHRSTTRCMKRFVIQGREDHIQFFITKNISKQIL